MSFIVLEVGSGGGSQTLRSAPKVVEGEGGDSPAHSQNIGIVESQRGYHSGQGKKRKSLITLITMTCLSTQQVHIPQLLFL